MAKATLEFDLTDFDDRIEHMRAVKSLDMAIALFDIIYNLHKDVERTVEAKEMREEDCTPYDVVELYREKISDIINSRSINIDDLIV